MDDRFDNELKSFATVNADYYTSVLAMFFFSVIAVQYYLYTIILFTGIGYFRYGQCISYSCLSNQFYLQLHGTIFQLFLIISVIR